MDIARCIEDNRTYNAFEFSALSPAELGRKRRMLICDECEGPGFFRKASRSGQAACFGARPHAPDCSAAAAEGREVVTQQEDDEPRLNPGAHIVVDLHYGGTPVNGIQGDDADNSKGAGGSRYVGGGGKRAAVSHRRPSGLLRMLVESEGFRSSEQTIEIPGHIQGIVREIFIPLGAAAVDELIGQYRGYWGYIADGARGGEALWLNSGGRQDVSILVHAEKIDELYKRFNIEDVEDFAGVYFLVFGHLRKSARNKYYIGIDDIDACVVYSPAD
ncbi:hypothetical protein KDW40_26155 [Burkholderia cenocepacia]|uniref:hypothetical protein n=1 Tax=Burkholderia cenocepacia TaxID=95486 RepID=UPI001B97108A|nr:hypothetical protein [Burkholderia cenocepacia]MBR8043451.1 hypothetical protein [Burkholderia cenocepacia]MBR8329217.1 hypothetical protein [Burkholderia cenocepacia]